MVQGFREVFQHYTLKIKAYFQQCNAKASVTQQYTARLLLQLLALLRHARASSSTGPRFVNLSTTMDIFLPLIDEEKRD